jgi:hypothetical protein
MTSYLCGYLGEFGKVPIKSWLGIISLTSRKESGIDGMPSSSQTNHPITNGKRYFADSSSESHKVVPSTGIMDALKLTNKVCQGCHGGEIDYDFCGLPDWLESGSRMMLNSGCVSPRLFRVCRSRLRKSVPLRVFLDKLRRNQKYNSNGRLGTNVYILFSLLFASSASFLSLLLWLSSSSLDPLHHYIRFLSFTANYQLQSHHSNTTIPLLRISYSRFSQGTIRWSV